MRGFLRFYSHSTPIHILELRSQSSLPNAIHVREKGVEMAINWFEGGRRISKLCIGIVVAIGAATVLWRNEPDPVLTIRGPTMPWFVSLDSCPANAYVRYLWDYDRGGSDPGLRLCFLPLPNGSIPYAVAPTPPHELERQAQDKRDKESAWLTGSRQS